MQLTLVVSSHLSVDVISAFDGDTINSLHADAAGRQLRIIVVLHGASMPYGGRARAACQPVATEAKAEATDGSGTLPTVINRATAGRCRRLPSRPARPLRRRETVAEIPHSKLSRRRRRARRQCQQTARISHSKAFSEIIGSAISGRHITISACQCNGRNTRTSRHATQAAIDPRWPEQQTRYVTCMLSVNYSEYNLPISVRLRTYRSWLLPDPSASCT